MVARWHPPSLTVLPTEVAIEIAIHLVATLEWPMDDLRSRWMTCSFMRHMCSDRAIGRGVALDRFRCAMLWNESDRYNTLVASLIQPPPPCLDDLDRAAAGGHNVAAYVVALSLYRDNGGAGDDDTARQYMRRVEGGRIMGGGGRTRRMRMLCNKGVGYAASRLRT
uniref:Uncharacterized protein n=1 Tax=Setaria italica TaxID=4555 RepID=K4A003_SETIT